MSLHPRIVTVAAVRVPRPPTSPAPIAGRSCILGTDERAERGQRMRNIAAGMRGIWRSLFTLPGRTTANNEGTGVTTRSWIGFLLLWLWAIVGAIPGGLAAAYIIGRFHVTDQRLQDVESTALAVLSMLLIQVLVFTSCTGGRAAFDSLPPGGTPSRSVASLPLVCRSLPLTEPRRRGGLAGREPGGARRASQEAHATGPCAKGWAD
jgi:hypothetical protein